MIDAERVELEPGEPGLRLSDVALPPIDGQEPRYLGIGRPLVELRKVRGDGVVMAEPAADPFPGFEPGPRFEMGVEIEREAAYLADYQPARPGAMRFGIPAEDELNINSGDAADMQPTAGAQIEGRSFSASFTRLPETLKLIDVDATASIDINCEAQPRFWERGTFGQPGYEWYNGDVFVDPPPEGFRPVYGRDPPGHPSYPRRDNETVTWASWAGNDTPPSISCAAPNGDSIEESDDEDAWGIPELRTPIAWNAGPDDWCYGSKPPSAHDWQPVYYADGLPARYTPVMRFSAVTLAWCALVALVAGVVLDRYVLPHVHGLG